MAAAVTPALLADERGGSVDMGSVSASIWDTVGVNSFQALGVPFLITNYKLEKAVLDSPIGRDAGGTGEVQLRGLAIHEGGAAQAAVHRHLHHHRAGLPRSEDAGSRQSSQLLTTAWADLAQCQSAGTQRHVAH